MNRLFFIVAISFFLVGLNFNSEKRNGIDLDKQKWIHGSEDCKTNHDPLIQVVSYNADTWILRQNKCIHYEAPFIFLFVGEDQSLLIDTGATPNEKLFPLRPVVDSILLANKASNRKLIVAHTHSHGDHIAADDQFKTRPNTEVIGLNWDAIQKYFSFNDSKPISLLELGNRSIAFFQLLVMIGFH